MLLHIQKFDFFYFCYCLLSIPSLSPVLIVLQSKVLFEDALVLSEDALPIEVQSSKETVMVPSLLGDGDETHCKW